MPAPALPPALPPALIARLERAQAACEAALQRAAGMEVLEIGDPVPAARCWRSARPDPSLDRCSGLTDLPAADAEDPPGATYAATALLDRIEQFLGPAAALDLSPAVPPALAALLAPRGYRLRAANHLLWRPLPPDAPDLLPIDLPPGAAILPVSDDPAEAARWSRLVSAAHLGLPPGTPLPRLIPPAAPGVRSFWILLDGTPVGGGSLGVSDRIAVLCGDALLPAARGRRLQRALIAHRLRLARAAGADLACAVTAPASASQRNCEACGLVVGYPRLTLQRAPPRSF